jgi:hypothetical protein
MDSDFLFANAKHIWARWPNGALIAIILRFRQESAHLPGKARPCAMDAKTA